MEFIHWNGWDTFKSVLAFIQALSLMDCMYYCAYILSFLVFFNHTITRCFYDHDYLLHFLFHAVFSLKVSIPSTPTQCPRSDSINSNAYTVLLTTEYSDQCNAGACVCVCVRVWRGLSIRNYTQSSLSAMQGWEGAGKGREGKRVIYTQS